MENLTKRQLLKEFYSLYTLSGEKKGVCRFCKRLIIYKCKRCEHTRQTTGKTYLQIAENSLKHIVKDHDELHKEACEVMGIPYVPITSYTQVMGGMFNPEYVQAAILLDA